MNLINTTNMGLNCNKCCLKKFCPPVFPLGFLGVAVAGPGSERNVNLEYYTCYIIAQTVQNNHLEHNHIDWTKFEYSSSSNCKRSIELPGFK